MPTWIRAAPSFLAPSLLALLCCFAVGCETYHGGQTDAFEGVKFLYDTPWKLRRAEKAELLKLAATCGMTNVESVSTGYVMPTSLIEIRIKGRETVTEREVRYRTLSVDLRRWNPQREIPVSFVKQRSKHFTVIDDTVKVLTRLYVNNAEFRVRVDSSIAPSIAEEMLSRFLRRDIVFQRDAGNLIGLEQDLKDAQPTSINKETEGKCSITFWRGGAGSRYIFTRDESNGAIQVVSRGSIII